MKHTRLHSSCFFSRVAQVHKSRGRLSVRPHSFIQQAPANNWTTWRVSCLTAAQISPLFFINNTSSTFVFRDRLPRWLSISSVGECLKWDGDRHSWDHVRRCHFAIFSAANWETLSRFELKRRKKKKRRSNTKSEQYSTIQFVMMDTWHIINLRSGYHYVS